MVLTLSNVRSGGRGHVRGAVHEQRVDLHRRPRGESRVEKTRRPGRRRRSSGKHRQGEEELSGVDGKREKLSEEIPGDYAEDSAPKDQRGNVQKDTDQVFR